MSTSRTGGWDETFYSNGSGGFTPPPGPTPGLVENSNGCLTLAFNATGEQLNSIGKVLLLSTVAHSQADADGRAASAAAFDRPRGFLGGDKSLDEGLINRERFHENAAFGADPWPVFAKTLMGEVSAARCQSASAKTMLGDLPPNSRKTWLKVARRQFHDSAAHAGRAGEGEPGDRAVEHQRLANEQRRGRGRSAWSTPGGRPARWADSPRASAVSGESEAA